MATGQSISAYLGTSVPHSRSPWKVVADGTVRSDDFAGSTQMGDYLGCIVCDTSPGHGNREHAKAEAAANARLIAAAPDLLAALQLIVDTYGFDSSVDSAIWQTAFNALDKAGAK